MRELINPNQFNLFDGHAPDPLGLDTLDRLRVGKERRSSPDPRHDAPPWPFSDHLPLTPVDRQGVVMGQRGCLAVR